MIEVSNVALSLDAGLEENEILRKKELARALGISAKEVKSIAVIRRGIDARKRSNVHFVATLCVELLPSLEARLLKKSPKGVNIKEHKPYVPLAIPACSLNSDSEEANMLSPVVVGAGPAGLFAALYLARAGLKPILIEQGAAVEQRAKDVDDFVKNGHLNPFSNIQFGEGGAGTFSDGKLTTNTKNAFTPHVLHWFVDAGAPEEILWQGNPHLGSDNLPTIVRNMREEIIHRGGKVLFNTKFSDFSFKQGKLSSITYENLQTKEVTTISCKTLILACGHSSRDVFALCKENAFAMEQKPFSVGVRIEHPQSMINRSLWGSAANHPALKAAAYKLAVHLPSGRSVYTFCMCPGGTVVAAASEKNAIVTNGMSNFARDGKNANSAVLVNVDPKDFPSADVLAGVELQRTIEAKAFQVSAQFGGLPYQAPAQTVGSFLDSCTSGNSQNNARSAGKNTAHKIALQRDVESTYTRGVVKAPISECFPSFVSDSLRDALPLLGKKLAGFDDPHAIMIAPETRSSSPVRICRTKTYQAYFQGEDVEQLNANPKLGSGVYPCGEGPGFAGGIMSAAVDGLRIAEQVASCYQIANSNAQFKQVFQALREGKPAIFPTDTIYGLGVSTLHAQTPKPLYELKHREENKPIAWLVGSISDLSEYGRELPAYAIAFAKRFWPGPLTLIVKASDKVPGDFLPKQKTLGLRMPDDETALGLIRKLGCPLATTSANISGESPACIFDDLDEELLQKVAYIYDADKRSGIASTIVDCTGAEPSIIRLGAISEEQIKDVFSSLQ